MKDRILFVSDFDNTISLKDFYWVVIEKYFPIEGRQEYVKWKQGAYTDFEFLSWVFGRLDLSEQALREDILRIPLDPYFKVFVDDLWQHQGEICIVSAGNDYYINILLQRYQMTAIPVYSNLGLFDKRAIKMQPSSTEVFFSPRYGIDKAKVVESLKKPETLLCYAGDSDPDFEAGKLATIRFAKGELQPLYRQAGIDFVPIESYKDIHQYFMKEVWP